VFSIGLRAQPYRFSHSSLERTSATCRDLCPVCETFQIGRIDLSLSVCVQVSFLFESLAVRSLFIRNSKDSDCTPWFLVTPTDHFSIGSS
jgi:hypothetical protein